MYDVNTNTNISNPSDVNAVGRDHISALSIPCLSATSHYEHVI